VVTRSQALGPGVPELGMGDVYRADGDGPVGFAPVREDETCA